MVAVEIKKNGVIYRKKNAFISPTVHYKEREDAAASRGSQLRCGSPSQANGCGSRAALT